jgi:hypothetical protein
MQQVRRIDLLWEGDDVETYEALKQKSMDSGKDLAELIKEIIEREIQL